MRHAITFIHCLLVCTALVRADTRADLSGDAMVDFQTTMDMPFMTVGNPGNAVDTEVMSTDGTFGYGRVDYTYNIGKFEVTAGQYTEFLNAVAATDTYNLYNPGMWSQSNGCKIERSGSSGSYSYSISADRADRPVNNVNWGAAARFANWLTNGMPTGVQDLTTTEDGSYFLNGALTNAELMAVTRADDARYVIPSEDEWYKAAFYDPTLSDGSGGYHDYPTGVDVIPSNDLVDPDPGNNATFYDGGYTLNSPYCTTAVGEFENSVSPYGVFDMAGNAYEWNEGIPSEGNRGLRGGSFYGSHGASDLHASYRHHNDPPDASTTVGFRIAEVPEPMTMSLLTLGGVAMLKRRRTL